MLSAWTGPKTPSFDLARNHGLIRPLDLATHGLPRVSLTRYALERLLYRLGRSSHAERFLLKGALLFDLWFDIPHRPTRDADLLGFGTDRTPSCQNLPSSLR